jgi:hypothetical protein
VQFVIAHAAAAINSAVKRMPPLAMSAAPCAALPDFTDTGQTAR